MAARAIPTGPEIRLLKRERLPADTSKVMWLIPALLAVILLVPAAIFGASIAHDSAASESDRVGSRQSADRDHHR